MNNYINYNELRRLATKIEKKRPILGSLLIKEGNAYFTDSFYIVAMGGYQGSPDMVINLNTYGKPAGEYPDLTRIMEGPFNQVTFEEAIYGGRVINQFKRDDGLIVYIDEEIKNQIKKLVADKKFTLDISQIKINRSIGLYEINEDTKIYFELKKKN